MVNRWIQNLSFSRSIICSPSLMAICKFAQMYISAPSKSTLQCNSLILLSDTTVCSAGTGSFPFLLIKCSLLHSVSSCCKIYLCFFQVYNVQCVFVRYLGNMPWPPALTFRLSCCLDVATADATAALCRCVLLIWGRSFGVIDIPEYQMDSTFLPGISVIVPTYLPSPPLAAYSIFPPPPCLSKPCH